MHTIVKLVLFTAFCACLIWAFMKPGYDSVTATIVSLGALLAALSTGKKTEPTQSQKVGNNSTVIQAGRNVKIKK